MPIAVITLAFDPILHVGSWSVPWEIVGVGASIFLALVVAALVAGRSSGSQDDDVEADEPYESDDKPADAVPDGPRNGAGHLRRDDVLLIALGILPGAVAGGRLVYALVHLDYYSASPAAIVDASVGSLSLTGGVLGGIVTGSVVAHLLGPSVGRWMRAAAIPALVALGLGKASLALGADGQGSLSDGPLAVRYASPGPWSDPLATVPALPSQLLEAAAVGLVVLVVMLLGTTRFARSARLFGVAIALWAVVRAVVASTWRDVPIAGPFRAEQLLCLGLAVVSLAAAVAARRPARQRSVGRVLEES